MSAQPLRMAVIGCGYLGNFHAEKVASLPQTELVAAVDVDPGKAQAQADKHGCRAATDVDEVIRDIDAACVVAPTTAHHRIGMGLIEAGRHVLMEKPIAASVAEARELVDAAAQNNVVLQVGHLERFNPIWRAVGGELGRPWYMNIERLAMFGERGIDVNVLMDLMIHDLDLVLNMMGEDEIERIDAVGVPVVTEHIDIANARIQFKSGTVANITASRVSQTRVRKLRLFQMDAYLSIDLQERKAEIVRREGATESGFPALTGNAFEAPPGDAILAEVEAFADCVQNGTPVAVSGRDGLRALELAVKIREAIHAHPLAPKLFEEPGGR